MKIYSFQIAANSNSLVQTFWDIRGIPKIHGIGFLEDKNFKV